MRVSKLFFICLLVAMSILFIQCEKKPVNQMEIAKNLYKKLQTEESSHYAPEKFDMALNHYNQAMNSISQKEYKKASTQLEYFMNSANAALSETLKEKENELKNRKEAEIVYSDNETEELNDTPTQITDMASPAMSGGTVHVIEDGECLTGIAKKYYRDAKYWQAIQEANKDIISDAGLIFPGQEITIPEIQTEVVLKANEYRIQEGENLWMIAEKMYPNSDLNHWQMIYKENKDKIYNPNIIRSGLIISIPDLGSIGYASGDTTYVVKKGDTFWSIANMINGQDTSRTITWQQIYQLNMIELSDSNSIYPDQLLILP